MLIIGCDYHPGFQQIAFVDTETGELGKRRLAHREEAEQFYGRLKQRSVSVRVGMEASGHARWFERLLSELHFELCIGDAAAIRRKRVRKQKTDRQDAQLLLPGPNTGCVYLPVLVAPVNTDSASWAIDRISYCDAARSPRPSRA